MINKVIISGGLGNQMFQYAFALALRHNDYRVKIDVSLYNSIKMHNGYELSRVFCIDENVINKKGLYLVFLRALLKFKPSILVRVDPIQYDSNCLRTEKRYFSGVWLSENYFKSIQSDIKNTFQFKNINLTNKRIATEMQSSNSVSVHIRRGDYTSWGISLLGDEYYKKAISIINERIPDPKFYFFSDDLIIAKQIAEQMNIDYAIIGHNQGENAYQDMYLMSNCRHNIIANSSFSWWGAWLNSNCSRIVIAPKDWVEKKDKLHHPQLDSWILI